MDRFTNVLVWAGLGCFALAFLLSAVYPHLVTNAQEPEATIPEITKNVSPDFKDLKDRWPVAFGQAFPEQAASCRTPRGIMKDLDARNRESAMTPAQWKQAYETATRDSLEAWQQAYALAARRGRDLYVAEGCWHCHSQYVRPVANEDIRFGEVLDHRHYNNALNRPVLWGTRRVGPDLTHEGGKRTNDWHAAHLWNPRHTSPDSVMPRYSWYFREGWQVRRVINEDVAERESLSDERSYPLPGIHETREQAETAMQALQEDHYITQLEEEESLLVAEGRGLDADGLCLVAYLQWLGTWKPRPLPKEDQ